MIFVVSRMSVDVRGCTNGAEGAPTPAVVQVKQKLGTLRYYIDRAPLGRILDFIQEAERRSGEICECCGAPGERRNDCFIKTLCEDCRRAATE